MRIIARLAFTLTLFSLFISTGYALNIPASLTLKTDFKIWTIKPKSADFYSEYNKIFFNGIEIKLLNTDIPFVEQYLNKGSMEGIDMAKIRRYLEEKIVPAVFREKEDVIIDKDEDGNITFEGTGLYGRYLDIEKAAVMIKNALENDIGYLTLPLVREDPVVTVLDEELQQMGIAELYSAGETDFSGSPYNRTININVGLSKLNTHIIKPNEEFIFGNVLGAVGPETGYKRELVIKGDQTVPEYGGGLCQVSTTAYRAVLSGGFPVTERKNHSYAVSYYSPLGLDATIYPPSPDLKFVNDSPAHILIQAFTVGINAYYNFYGTKDKREVYMIGPYYSGWTGAPAAKTKYTDTLAPGETQMVGHAVSGVSSSWFREVNYNEEIEEGEESRNFLNHIYSKYQARPDFYLIGSDGSANGSAEASQNGY